MDEFQIVKATPRTPAESGDLRDAPVGRPDTDVSTAAKLLRQIADLSNNALRVLCNSLQRACGQAEVHPPQVRESSKEGPEVDLNRKLHAAALIIDFALYGPELRGLMEKMPSRSLFGSASYASVKAYWEDVLQRSVESVAEEFMASARVPSESEERYMASAFSKHTAIYLRVAAAHDPEVIDRAIRLLPRYTQFLGATGERVT